MDTTQNLNLRKPAGSDYYNVADQNHNMDILDGAVIGTDVRNIRKITKTAFDALTTKSNSTVYLVTDSGTVTQYLGDTPVGGGGGSAGAITGMMSIDCAGAMFTPEILCGQMEMEE